MAIVNRKTLLISAGVMFTAVALNLIIPLMMKFATSGVPVLWSTVNSWLKPPYLYVVINGIILTIAASSMLCYKLEDENPSSPELVHDANRTVITPEIMFESRLAENKLPFLNESTTSVTSPAYGYELKVAEVMPEFGYEVKVPEAILPEFANLETQMTVYEQREDTVSEVKSIVQDEEDEYVISRSNWSPEKRISSSEISQLSSIPIDKQLVSSRFSHRKPIRASPEGGKAKALKVSKSKQKETFESTWKTITDGRHVPLTRHLRKSDTFENHDRPVPLDRNVIKSETFKDRTNYQPPQTVTSSPGLVKLRKEPSLSQDDLNRRVEAFITKFNEDMRLQRQQSLNQYKEMINRGA